MIESPEEVTLANQLADPRLQAPLEDEPRAHTNGVAQPEDHRDWALAGAEEIFRGIYTRAGIETDEVLAICSAIAGEGRSSLALGLGLTIARDFPERTVLLVETDLGHPVLAEDFAVPANPGLVDCLLDGLPISLAYRSTALGNLDFLPAGGPLRTSHRLLASSRMGSAVDTMRQTHDLVILDTPPVLLKSDALVLVDLADGMIFVVRAGVTPAPLVHKAISQLDEAKLRGVVLNDSRSAIPGWLRRFCGF